MKKNTFIGLMLGGLLSLSACSTVPTKYIPMTLGPVQESDGVEGIVCTIEPSNDALAIGDLLEMRVTIRNTGDEGVWFPKSPDIMMMWIYPNGKRDNMVFEYPDSRFYKSDQVVFLKPGQGFRTQVRIKTYYFPKPGITEFQAFCNSASNTNPDIRPFWQGRVFSNTYGVRMEIRRDQSS